jgi:hypothetical protein
MPFQKGNQLAAGKPGGMRRDPTIEIVTQLNELIDTYDGSKKRAAQNTTRARASSHRCESRAQARRGFSSGI